jgi:hypothetical protein
MFAYASRDNPSVIRTFAGCLAACALLVACGEGDDPAPTTDIPGGGDPEDVKVIEEWADTLRSGDVKGAAEFFAIPSVAQNGPLIPIESLSDAREFNAALPCGAELVRAETKDDVTTATFRLTERPGPGTCGAGTGETAETAFVIEDGLIVEWRRVGLDEGGGQGTIT